MIAIKNISNSILFFTKSEETVYADPIRQIQEKLYTQLLAVREGFATTLTSAISEAENATPSTKPAEETKVSAASNEADSEELTKLRAENKKLNYRVLHLKKALDEKTS